jgi:hypothetical protein
VEPLTVPNNPLLRGYLFKTIRFIGPDPDNAGQTKTVEIADRGWTFVGRPGPAPAVRRGQAGLMFADGPWWGDGGLRLAGNRLRNWGETAQDMKERYDNAKETYDKVNETRERWKDWNKRGDDSAVDDLTDMQHYEDGLDKATDMDPYDKLDWIDKHLNRVRRAWEWASDQLAGGDSTSSSRNHGGGGVATPGNRGRQRLGQSQRSY